MYHNSIRSNVIPDTTKSFPNGMFRVCGRRSGHDPNFRVLSGMAAIQPEPRNRSSVWFPIHATGVYRHAAIQQVTKPMCYPVPPFRDSGFVPLSAILLWSARRFLNQLECEVGCGSPKIAYQTYILASEKGFRQIPLQPIAPSCRPPGANPDGRA